MKFENGPMVTIEVGTSHYIEAPRWYVCGDRGALIIPDWSCNGKRWCAPASTRSPGKRKSSIPKPARLRTMAPRAKRHHRGNRAGCGQIFLGRIMICIYHNIAAVLDGTEELRVKPEETLRGMLVMEAVCIDRTGEAIQSNI